MRTAVKPAVLLLFSLALGIRLFNLNIPFLEPFNNYSRQSMCASVARNFYEHGFNLFYPEIDENGSGPALYNVEMPIHSYLMALGYWLAGGAREWAARFVSVFFSMGFLGVLYLFVKELEGEKTARWALGFAALSPMAVALSRSIQPDISMLFTATTALYFFLIWRKSSRAVFLAASALCLALAVLIRPFALYFFLPMIYLAWEKEGFCFLKNWRYYACAAAVSLSLGWYFYMWKMGHSLDLHYQPYKYSDATEHFRFLDFFKPGNLKLPAKAFFLHLLTPLGAVLFFLGIFEKGPGRKFFGVLFFSTVLYLALLWKTAVIHPYYFLPLIPPCSYFVAKGAQRVRRPWILTVGAVLLVFNLMYYYRLLYFVPQDRMAVVEAGQVVDRLAPPGALVAAAYGASPIQLYYAHRKGWVFDLAQEDRMLPLRLEELKKKGATYFVTTELNALSQKPGFAAYLSRYPAEKKADRYVIYNLGGD